MYLLFDIGGTNMRFAVAGSDEKIGEPAIVPTPQDFDEVIEAFRSFVREYVKDADIQAAAGGVPGPLNQEKSILLNPPNLPGWSQKPLKEELQKAFRSKVFLENDAALAGLGEAVYGAGKGKKIVAYLTIGTGVGGARIVNGKIDENSYGFEPGHQVISSEARNKVLAEGEVLICFDGEACGCGGAGHLEAYISGTAIEKRYHKKPYEITDEKIWDELAKFLAYGLNNTIVHWSPDMVVLGGSMMKEVGIPIERVRFYLKKIVKIFPELPPIKKAEFGDKAGLWGGLAYLKQQLTANSYKL